MHWKAFWNPFERLGAAPAALLLAATAWLLAACSMSDLTRVSSEQFPRPESCGDCHVDIFDEWKQSPHARAFTNPRFRAATDGYRFEQCTGCHAPEPVMISGEPTARRADRESGVVCVSCHLDDGAMVGPLPPTGMARPHPIKVDPTPFEGGALCGHCHQGTLAQWRAAVQDEPRDCRVCHMPAVERKATQATGVVSRLFVAAEEVAIEHRHLFILVPGEGPVRPFTFGITQSDGRADLALTNRLPHDLPTGDFGVRIVEIVVEGIDAQGGVSLLGKWELTSAGNGSLSSGQSRRWSIAIPAGVGTIRAVVTRHGGEGTEPVVLLREEVAVQ